MKFREEIAERGISRTALIDAPAREAVRAERRPVGRPKKNTRDAVIACQYKQLASAGPAILKRLIEGALDREDAQHGLCLDILAKRLAPIAFWEGLAKREFTPEGEQGGRPIINITVGTTAGVEKEVVAEQ